MATKDKNKTNAKKGKITKISPEIELVKPGERDLDWYRSRLNIVRQKIWDRCWHGLDSDKAMGKWPELIKKIEEYMSFVEITSEETEIELNFDVVATREVASA